MFNSLKSEWTNCNTSLVSAVEALLPLILKVLDPDPHPTCNYLATFSWPGRFGKWSSKKRVCEDVLDQHRFAL